MEILSSTENDPKLETENKDIKMQSLQKFFQTRFRNLQNLVPRQSDLNIENFSRLESKRSKYSMLQDKIWNR